jgi:DNA-binding NarL/FixJ family response regulator
MPPTDQTRLLIVEDVPQVAQYIRGLLNSQARVKLLDVLGDGSKVVATIQELRPDIVLVDALLQGRIKGPKLVEMIHEAELGVPVIVLTVPQNPVEPDPSKGIHGVLSMPFSGFDLMTRIGNARKEYEEQQAVATTRVMSVFAPKGGVGKTTIAFNLAVALGQLEQRTVLIDGSLQFGDLRSLLKVPVDAPSILDLPTDRIAESDLTDVIWRDPSGIDILVRLDDDPQHGRDGRYLPLDRLPRIEGALPRQPCRFARWDRPDRPRARPRSRPRASCRVGRHARHPIEQRGCPVRPGESGRADHQGRHAGRA